MKESMAAAAELLERLGDTVPATVALEKETGLPPVRLVATGDHYWPGDGEVLVEAASAAYGVAVTRRAGAAICDVRQNGVGVAIMSAPKPMEGRPRTDRVTSTRGHAALLRGLVDWAAELPAAVVAVTVVDDGTGYFSFVRLARTATDNDWAALAITNSYTPSRRIGHGVLPSGHAMTVTYST